MVQLTVCAKDIIATLCETAHGIELPEQLGGSGLRVNAGSAVRKLNEVFPVS